jgi:integrase
MARQGKETGSKARIAKRSVDDLRARAKDQGRTLYLRDDETTGFGVVATKAGAASYFVEYRLGGRGTAQKRMTIGKHGVLTPDEARKLAKEELGKVARGADVVQEKREAREKLTGQTLRELIERYLAGHAKPTRYWTEKRARLLSDDLKALHAKPAALIKRAEIAAVIDKVQARSHAAARLLFADVRPIFAWALDRAAIEVNPLTGMKGPQPLDARDRVLSDEEVKAFWQAASAENWPFSSVFKTLLLTGQRREEVAAMRWREVDLDAGQWTIAKERCKNGKAHTVDLHPEAIRLLDRLGDAATPRLMKDTEEREDLVYSTTGTTPVSGFSKAKGRIDARMQAILGDKFQPWRTHDLRRTGASGMAALGFQPHVIERVLNHISGAQGGLVGVYQRHEYREERRRAIREWGDHLMKLVSGTGESQGTSHAASNVVTLQRRTG